jgi:SAM-dependent methyltransferase
MHADQMRFFDLVIAQFPQHFAGRVLDIGSLDINGGLNDRFDAKEYIGVDIGPGENVHLVAHGENLDLPTGSFDVVMSSECFEHNPAWRATLNNMIRMARPGGLIAFSCATTGRPEHGTSRSDRGFGAPLAVEVGQEYYANVAPSQVWKCIDRPMLAGGFTAVNDRIFDLYFVGIKAPGDGASRSALATCERLVRDTFESYSSYGDLRSFARDRSRRYVARVVGDKALWNVRSVLRRSEVAPEQNATPA